MARRWRIILPCAAALTAIVSFALWLEYGHSGCGPIPLTRMQTALVAGAVVQYRSDTGHWPESLDALLDDGPPGLGPYLRDGVLQDPWGRRLLYSTDPDRRGFTVFSLGRDGRLGGRGADADYEAQRSE